MNSLIDKNLITIDDYYKVGSNDFKDILTWEGQMYLGEAHGVGRSIGGFGIYEGLYVDGVPDGYGRIIFRN